MLGLKLVHVCKMDHCTVQGVIMIINLRNIPVHNDAKTIAKNMLRPTNDTQSIEIIFAHISLW